MLDLAVRAPGLIGTAILPAGAGARFTVAVFLGAGGAGNGVLGVAGRRGKCA